MLKNDTVWGEKDVAHYLDVSVRTVQDWRPRRKGPPFVKIEGSVRYLKSDVIAYVERNRSGADFDDQSSHPESQIHKGERANEDRQKQKADSTDNSEKQEETDPPKKRARQRPRGPK